MEVDGRRIAACELGSRLRSTLEQLALPSVQIMVSGSVAWGELRPLLSGLHVVSPWPAWLMPLPDTSPPRSGGPLLEWRFTGHEAERNLKLHGEARIGRDGLAFDGSSYACVGDERAGTIAGSFTIEAVVRLDRLGGYQTVCSKGSEEPEASERSYGLYFGARGEPYFTVNSGRRHYAVGGSRGVRLGEWAHVAATYDADKGTLRVFVDGAEAGVAEIEARKPDSCAGRFYVGGHERTRYGLRGAIKSLRVHATCLSAERIKALAERK